MAQALTTATPLSPPFHVDLIRGVRYLQGSLLLPSHGRGEFSARATPIRFEEVSPVKKPGKRADEAAWQQYREDHKRLNLSQRFVLSMEQIRGALDQAGAEHKTLVIAGDGSFCNRTVLAAIPQRTVAIVRARKDAKLCFAGVDEGRRVYAALKFTPESVRQDDRMPSYSPWLPPPTANVSPDAGTTASPLTCCAPTLKLPRELPQIYFDRCKSKSIIAKRRPSPVVESDLRVQIGAAYSALMLTALRAFGLPTRRRLHCPSQVAPQGQTPFLS